MSAGLFPEAPRRHRVFGGLTERQEHIFTWMAVVVVLLYATAWFAAINQAVLEERQEAAEERAARAHPAVAVLPQTAAPAVTPTRQITSAVLESGVPKAAFLSDAMLSFLTPLRGQSGKLLFATRTPGAPVASGAPQGVGAVFGSGGQQTASPDFAAPDQPGVYKLSVQLQQATKQLDNFNVITLVPFEQKRGGKIGLYYLGSWPFENGGKPKSAAYANPSGFIEVTHENVDTQISEHFRLRDFLTKDQPNVWPKYLLLNPKLLDKLELTVSELQAMGHPVRHVTVMSGFRTPNYNYHGGNTAGRANLSRHMYGDASDIFIDNDGNGSMDDLNGDGRVDTRDAEVVLAAAERVERKYPSLVGGVGVYSACCGHGPFTHIDVRGFRARWRGTSGG